MDIVVHRIISSGLDLEKLSSKSGLDYAKLRSFVNGDVDLTLDEVSKISFAMEVPMDFLLNDNPEFSAINVLFRKAANSEQDNFIADKFSYLISNAFTILDSYNSKLSLFERFSSISATYINAEKLSLIFRSQFCGNDNVVPLLDLPQILTQKLGCLIYTFNISNDIDGASAIIKDIPFIFISPRFIPRMLFTLAHELGHLIANHHQNFAIFDRNVFSFTKSKFKDESFANAFASSLLLPREAIGLTLKTIREIHDVQGPIGDVELIYLSRIYGVSFEVAAKRCEDLELLPKGSAFSLYSKLKKNHGSPEKRADELNIPSRPEITFPFIPPQLISSAVHKVREGELSLGKAAEILGVSVNDVLSYNLTMSTNN